MKYGYPFAKNGLYTVLIRFFFMKIAIANSNEHNRDINVVIEHNQLYKASPTFRFRLVPSPQSNDRATEAKFLVIDEQPNGGKIYQLHNGLLPKGKNEPGENFFFTISLCKNLSTVRISIYF